MLCVSNDYSQLNNNTLYYKKTLQYMYCFFDIQVYFGDYTLVSSLVGTLFLLIKKCAYSRATKELNLFHYSIKDIYIDIQKVSPHESESYF